MKEPSFWLDVVAGKLPPCHHVSYQYGNQATSTERSEQFLQAGCQTNPTNSVTALKNATSTNSMITNCLFPRRSGETFGNQLFPRQFSDYG